MSDETKFLLCLLAFGAVAIVATAWVQRQPDTGLGTALLECHDRLQASEGTVLLYKGAAERCAEETARMARDCGKGEP